MLKDKRLQERLDKDGFVVFDLLNDEEVKGLFHQYQELHPFDLGPKIFASNRYHEDKEYQKKVRETLYNGLMPSFKRALEDFDWMEAVFSIKPPGAGIFDCHQDWSIVNESKARSYNIWIPLIDVFESNGALGVVEGSHKFFQSYRSSTVPALYEAQELKDLLWEHTSLLDMKAGQGVIFDHATVHSSTPNTSDVNRPAIIVGIMPAGEQMFHYYLDKEKNKVEEFEVDRDFFFTYDYQSRPEGVKSTGFLDYELPSVKPEELLDKINQHKKVEAGFFSKLMSKVFGN